MSTSAMSTSPTCTAPSGTSSRGTTTPVSEPATLQLGTRTFDPISLAELVDRAALLSRTDRKYLLPVRTAADAICKLARSTRVLEIDGKRDFDYDSVYFDTEDHLVYRLTAQSRRRRFKLRTRSYLDTGGCFLEVKTKGPRNETVKRRIPYETADKRRLTARGQAYAAPILEEQGHDPHLPGQMRASLTSRYRRTTLLLPEGSRATIDTELGWYTTAPHAGHRETHLPGFAILETKSAGGANMLDRTLWRMGFRPLGISKFGTGTAALNPHLPQNKWARVLREPFGIEQTPRITE